MIDLKNKGKNSLVSRGGMLSQTLNGSETGGIGMSTVSFAHKFDILVEEVNQLWSFVQRYIDEQVIDGI